MRSFVSTGHLGVSHYVKQFSPNYFLTQMKSIFFIYIFCKGIDMDASAAALKTANDLAGMKDMNATLEGTVTDLRKANKKLDETVNRLKEEIKDAKSHTKLAEKQYAGLKDTIRGLQEENDVIKSENTKLVDRLVSEKEKSMDQVREMSETVEKLVKEIEMLKSLKKLEEKQKKGLWFTKAGSSEDGNGTDDKQENKQDNARQWGTLGVIIPTEAKHVIQAHSSEVTSVRYDMYGPIYFQPTDFVLLLLSDLANHSFFVSSFHISDIKV
jgi:regulator of replication initiation timing